MYINLQLKLYKNFKKKFFLDKIVLLNLFKFLKFVYYRWFNKQFKYSFILYNN